MDQKARQYAMVSGISIILCLVSAFFWAQAGYAMPSVQGAATLLLGAAYFICGFKTSLLFPPKEPYRAGKDAGGNAQGDMEMQQKAA